MSLNLYVLLISSFLPWIKGHGRLIEPPSRASAWRYGFDTPHNYNDHELYCGGFSRQWVKNGGKCGVCGDPWDAKLPRAHEYGGTYGQGIIVRRYGVGAPITIRVELTANHFGYFEFAICPDYKTPSQQCFDNNVLKMMKPQDGLTHRNIRYFPKEGNKVYEIKYKLPAKKCEHCLLQWRYIAGNNWGTCPNGTGAVGCGPQEEFRACADINISGKGEELDTESPPASQPPEEVPGVTTSPEESYSPISALILSLMSFLVVFLILSLLFSHYYQVGKKIKAWLKSGGKIEKNTERSPIELKIGAAASSPSQTVFYQAPNPPPRIKRNRSISSSRDDLHDVDLSESAA